MTLRSDEVCVRDMLDAIALINEFVAGMTFERFTEDRNTQSAVIREIEVLGEAAKNVSGDLKARRPEVAWAKAAAMRDVVAHEYWGVDLRIVWDTIELNLPELESQLRSILNEMASG
ncbi:MAG: DUF86 domain-containing protein [Clostridia bacterium]|nr:DUF86 domain-containing protein [Clostridia bacterium]